ncbi:MAG: cob(I)yrinic acid a,c-diamide adenosyltransferase [Rhodospirillaceae bacterium]|nr:MAG: cob(I)yrinic acid a,c-diamide adenosyltransferase [Rhodospirillaceae bacterium]
MVKLNRIYTRGGDRGNTSLGDGSRVKKHDPLVEAYGTVDEANAILGVARLDVARLDDKGLADAMLARIQNDMFDLGADLCTPLADDEKPGAALRIVQAQIDRLEGEIDALNKDLGALTSFILPGGSAAAASLHVARTVVRRAERCIAAVVTPRINPLALMYANRLSDHLFVLGRYANARAGTGDVLWVPGAHRT